MCEDRGLIMFFINGTWSITEDTATKIGGIKTWGYEGAEDCSVLSTV